MKNDKLHGDDDITIEYIKEEGPTPLYVIQKLFIACLLKSTTTPQWTNTVIVIMHKKNDNTDLRNYRPITRVSYVYKLFMEVFIIMHHQQT